MPSVSKDQQKAACMAYLAKQGKLSPQQLRGAAKNMYENMNEQQLRDFCKQREGGDANE